MCCPRCRLPVCAGPAPLPRKGHVAVMSNSSHLIIHGGHSEVFGYFPDVWAFSVADATWQALPPVTSSQPVARDHHGAALWGGRLFVFGGQTGAAGVPGTLPVCMHASPHASNKLGCFG